MAIIGLLADKLYRRVQLFLPTAGNKDVRTFRHETLRGCQPDARAATCNERDFAFQFFHKIVLQFRSSDVRN
jgi:hypothetical protein